MDLNPNPPQFELCPTCGLKYLAGETLTCWVCGANMLGPPGEKIRSPELSPAAPQAPLQFSLATLLWVVSLISLQLGFCVSLPGLAILTFLLALPIMFRVHTAAQKRRAAERMRAPLIEFMAAVSLAELYADLIVIVFLAIPATLFACQVNQTAFEWQAYMVGGIVAASAPIVLYLYFRRSRRQSDAENNAK